MQRQVDSITISDPAKLKIVSDPLRQRILGEFAEPNTAQTAAKTLGIEGKGIYRHIDMLLEAGFLFVVSTKKKRGTIERTLQTSARRFVGEVESMQGQRESWRDFVEPMKTAEERGAYSRMLRATARIRPEDWPDFEAAFVELLGEYDLGEGHPTAIHLVAIELDESEEK